MSDDEQALTARPPVFVQAPKNTFLVKGRQQQQNNLTLNCKALQAEKIRFKCQGYWVPDELHDSKLTVDPQSGLPILDTSVPVYRNLLRGAGRDEPASYTCQCYAFAAAGPEETAPSVKSAPATISLAYLLKDFYREPASERSPVNSLVALPCLPPEGQPTPEIFWLKDGVEIVSRQDPNVIVANDGSLLISSARLIDSGNYTCGARNVAGERLTEPATVQIYVNGKWSEWGQWEGVCPTSCEVFNGASSRRAEAKLTRYRHCNNPPPSNGGEPCFGLSKDRLDCALPCPVDGHWSDWTRWSECQSNCKRLRRRNCDNPVPKNGGHHCSGVDHQWKGCSEHLCPAGRHHSNESDKLLNDNNAGANVAMYAGLGAAFFAFLLALAVVFFLFFRRRHCSSRCKDYETTTTTTFSSTVPVHSFLVQQNGQCQVAANIFDQSRVVDPCDVAKKPMITWCQQSASSAMYYPNASDDNNYATVDDSRVDYQYSEDRVSLMSSNQSRYTSSPSTVRSMSNGRCILLKNHAVSLFIPENGLSNADQSDVSIDVCEEECPPLAEGETLLTPVVWFRSNAGDTLKKPAVLSVEHGALLPSTNGCPPLLDNWTISCLVREQLPYEMSSANWTTAATVGQETLNTDVYCQVESKAVHVLIESFCRFAIVGQPKVPDSPVCKRTRILAFFGDQCLLRVYCAADTRTALNWVLVQEQQLGGRLCCIGAETFNMQISYDLYVRLEAVSSHWQLISNTNEQKLPATHLRAGYPLALHCSFVLSSACPPLDATAAFKARLHVHQLSKNSTVLDLDTEAWWDMSECFTTFFPAIRLPHLIKQRLAVLLDPPLESENDWRMLANLLRVDHYLPFFASRPSPTELILTLWESREPNVHGFVKLLHFLRRMRRPDACAVLSGFLNNP